jgi:hypothetical protein
MGGRRFQQKGLIHGLQSFYRRSGTYFTIRTGDDEELPHMKKAALEKEHVKK